MKKQEKKIRLQRMLPEEAMAYHALNHAVVRGEPEEKLNELRSILETFKKYDGNL